MTAQAATAPLAGTTARSGQQVVLGCMGFGGSWDPTPYGVADVDTAEQAVRAAVEVGITVLDLADIYRSGKSESVVGEVLANDPALRDQVRLQTKCGIRLGEDGLAVHYDLSAAAVRRRVEESLTRLRVDRVDTLLLHRPDPLTHPAETASALDALRAEGLVGQVGVSNMSAAQMGALQRHLEAPLAVNQLELSLARRDWIETDVGVNGSQGVPSTFVGGTLEHCAAHGVAVQAWSPLGRGLYSGAAVRDATDADRATAALVRSLAERHETTAEAVVLGWLMKHPASVDPVVGTTRPDRIRASADALRVSRVLTRTEWYALLVSARGLDLP